MKATFGRIDADIPGELPEELTTVLASGINVRIERIISRGHCSLENHWYDQEESEWVVLLAGAAQLHFEGSDDRVKMQPGDYAHIPAHAKHRVEWTEANTDTIWLAIFYR